MGKVFDKKISVVIPVYNEERYIAKCIDSLLHQDYPQNLMEWIFVDGISKDNTWSIMEEYQKRYPELIRIYRNENKTVPYAMNIGISKSEGVYIVRLDAHAEYPSDYISKCISCLETVDADNVGGLAETRSHGFVGGCIAKMLSSKFGVGNSQFRTNGESGYVDTVPFGAFRRDVFSRYGGYDERLTRNQDNEMNFRIRKNGGKIYLSKDINLAYYCRDTIKGIMKMGMQNGKWNVITMKLCPGSMGLRHFIPFLFVLSLIVMPWLCMVGKFFSYAFIAELALYLLLDILFSIKSASSVKEVPLLIVLFPLFHIAYGFGSFVGIFSLIFKRTYSREYKPVKI